MWYGYLADAMVAMHVAYVAFVLIGQVAILVGAALGWQWIRTFWFRVVHLIAIAIVGIEAAWGVDCPLTTWDNDLRQLAGQNVSEATFVGRFLHDLLFVEVPVHVLNLIHVAVALVVLATFVLIPPRWPWIVHKHGAADQSSVQCHSAE